MAIIRPLKLYVEDVPRRQILRFGQVQQLIQVWNGPISAYPGFNPQYGSSPLGFPLFYLQGLDKKTIGGSNYEVTLTYLGTDQQSALFSDLKINTDLLTKSFSWSGIAIIPYAITQTSAPGQATTFLATVSIEIQYQTVEVTFSYTTYKYLNGAIFASLAPNYGQLIDVYMQATTSNQVTPGAYTGVPEILSPIKPLVQLTRFSCDQLTPTQEINQGVNWQPNIVGSAGIWKCSETWGLNFTLGSLGFRQPNYVSSTP